MTNLEIRTLSYIEGKKAGLTFEECTNLCNQLLQRGGRAAAVDSLIADCKALLENGGEISVQNV